MTKNILDNPAEMAKLDKNLLVANSLSSLSAQLLAGWQTAQKIKLPANYSQAGNIIFCGMGGSHLAPELISEVFYNQIKKPLTLVRDYKLPAFADRNSLIVVCSYSGTTEEPLACLKEALKLKSKIIILAGGGELMKLADKNKLPNIIIDTSLNPSGQPRYGLGLQLGAVLNILSQIKVFKISASEIAKSAERLEKLSVNLLPNSKTANNNAKQLAKDLKDKNVLIIGAQHLNGNSRILANQINESAKQLAVPFKLPELNHHLLDAFGHPQNLFKNSAVIFLKSALYSPVLAKRLAVTQKVFQKLKLSCLIMDSSADNKLDSMLEILAFGSWVSFYLSMLNNENPSNIPWVNFFKKELHS